MDMFGLLKSKKTSEAGVWVQDEDVHECPLCSVKFNLLQRKHHCRQCGQVVCRGCSDNRKFLESSRTGAMKRVCDTCYSKDRKADDSEEEREETRKVAKAMGKVTISGAGASASASSGAGAKPAAGGRASAPALPEVTQEEAVESLKAIQWVGKWKFALTFYVVELSKAPAGADASAFKSSAVTAKSTSVKAGSKVFLQTTLKPKGAAYFQGECSEFGQFGPEGKVTGALQRSSGKVNMTLQIVNPMSKVTTSFNFVGACNASGQFVGTFSGCEISKTAGTVSGVFTGVPSPDSDGGLDGNTDGVGAETSAGQKSPGRAGGKTAAKKKAKSDSDSDSD